MLRKTFFAFVITCLLSSCQHSLLTSENFTVNDLKSCDLLFHASPQSNAITEVTQGVNKERIDHVAIFFKQNGKKCVIEAIERGVVITPLETFLKRKGKVIAGRLNGNVNKKKTIRTALSYLGRPYDHLYMRDNDAIYCSELVELSFVDKQGKRIFQPIPMSFHDENGEIISYWKEFYSAHGMQVPEGEPGSNPGDLSRQKNVIIKYLETKQQ